MKEADLQTARWQHSTPVTAQKQYLPLRLVPPKYSQHLMTEIAVSWRSSLGQTLQQPVTHELAYSTLFFPS